MKVFVHPRISQKHPQLSEDDVRTAFRNQFVRTQRLTGEHIGVGMDGKGRLIELVYLVGKEGISIFHALTPPTNKLLAELQARR